MSDSQPKRYFEIVRHYEHCLEKHGDSHLGIDCPRKEELGTNYRVMLDIAQHEPGPYSLLDFGCGLSYLYEYILRQEIKDALYSGLDISPHFIEVCRSKFPNVQYYCCDILESADKIPSFDYIVMSGVFTEKLSLSFEEMLSYVQQVLKAVFPKARKGIAFNFISKHVDWERDDLFHLPFDTLASFLKREISRNFVIRSDYGLYQYTAYVYR